VWKLFFATFLLALILSPACAAEGNVEDFESGFVTGEHAAFPWVSGGTGSAQPWACTTSSPYAGTYCGKSGLTGYNQTSYMEISFWVKSASPLSFFYKTSCAADVDYLRVYIDGELVFQATGETGWSQFTTASPVGAGTHTFRWEYVRGGSGGAGDSAVYLDDISLPFTDGLNLLSPAPGTTWYSGDVNTFRWLNIGASNPATVKLEYSLDGRISWHTIAEAAPNTGSYNWQFTSLQRPYMSPDAYVRITPVDGLTEPALVKIKLWEETEGFESGDFNSHLWMNAGSWQVASQPYRGGACAYGTGKLILRINVPEAGFLGFVWRANYPMNVSIDGTQVYSADIRDMQWRPATVPISAGVHNVTFNTPNGNTLYIDSLSFPAATGVLLDYPNGTANATGQRQCWIAGYPETIRWFSSGDPGNSASLQYSTDDGASWTAFPGAESVPNAAGNNAFEVTAPALVSEQFRVRVVPSAGEPAGSASSFDIWQEVEGFESGGLNSWLWINSGSWQVASQPYRGGANAYGTGQLTLRLNVPDAGLLRFVWRANYPMNVTIDGTQVYYADIRDMQWRPASVPLPAGVHSVTFNTPNGNTLHLDCLSFPVGGGVLLDYPNGTDNATGVRQCWISGYPETIRWYSFSGAGNSASLQYSTDDGASWTAFPGAESVPNAAGNNAFEVTAPALVPEQFRVRVVPSAGEPAASASSFDIWQEVEGFESGDLDSWLWTNGGSWQVASQPYRGGASAYGTGKLTLALTAPEAGLLRFVWRANYPMNVSIDGTQVYTADIRDMQWRPAAVPISAGAHTVTFNTPSGNTLYLDCLSFPVGAGVLVLEPRGGSDVWLAGDSRDIVWRSTGGMGAGVRIDYSDDGRQTWNIVAASASNEGPESQVRQYAWTVPACYTKQLWVRVTPLDQPDKAGLSPAAAVSWAADEGFETGFGAWPWTVGDGWTTVQPDEHRGVAAARFEGAGTSRLETTLSFDLPGFIGFYLKRSGDGSAKFFIDDVQQQSWTGTLEWSPAFFDVQAGTHKLTWEAANTANANTHRLYLDDVCFAPILRFGSLPASAWDAGATLPLTWTFTRATGSTVSLDYSPDGGLTWVPSVSGAGNTGSYLWPVPVAPSPSALLRITGSRSCSDVTQLFAITGVHWLSPQNGEALAAYQMIDLVWESGGTGAAQARLEYTSDAGASWKTIADVPAAVSSYSWPVPNEPTSKLAFRVTAGAYSDVSDGWCSIVGETRIGDIKRLWNGTLVSTEPVLVSAVWDGVFYVQAEDRSAGMRVAMDDHGVAAGDRVHVSGVTSTTVGGERFIEAVAVTQSGVGAAAAISMPNRAVGGGDFYYTSNPRSPGGQKGIEGMFGLNNIGLLVTTYGRVTDSGRGWFYVDDGSAVSDGSGVIGICVDAGGMQTPAAGSLVSVTGISRCEYYLGKLVNLLSVRAQPDILVHDIGLTLLASPVDGDAPHPRSRTASE